jgi:hypothetical protein
MSRMDRRDFLRWGVGAALAGGVSLLVLRPKSDACELPLGCDECAKFEGCGLPKAEERRVRFSGRRTRPQRAAASATANPTQKGSRHA